jgi:hypothetical protein
VQWRESKVRESLQAIKLNFQLIEIEEEIPYYRYSLSDVLHYGLEKSTGDIVIYTTCDVIITTKLLTDICAAMKSFGVVIPHQYPEMPYGVPETDYAKYLLEDPTNTGIDIFAFSGESARSFLNDAYFQKNRFLGWGMFDHLIIAGCLQRGISILKLSAVDSTIKFHNDRNQNGETNSWMKKCHDYNVTQFRKYLGVNLNLLPLLSLKALHQAVEKNGMKATNLIKFRGLGLIKSQVWFLVKNFR